MYCHTIGFINPAITYYFFVNYNYLYSYNKKIEISITVTPKILNILFIIITIIYN